jgi:pyridoxal phosphate enzyme (YggS family)
MQSIWSQDVMQGITRDMFKKNLEKVRERVAASCHRSGRHHDSVRIMAVTKSFPVSYVGIALASGITLFGENRIQEAAVKYERLRSSCELHLIGHLQRNKAKKAVELFTCIHSIDNIETANALAVHAETIGKTIDILIEINTTEEETKFGLRNQNDYFPLVDSIFKLNYVNLCGLMTVGPFTSDKKRIRAAFSTLRRIYEKTRETYPDHSFPVLSMGMSSDYDIAVEEGATLVRIGSALFGERQ